MRAPAARALAVLAGLTLAAGATPAQVAANRTTAYLVASDVTDARAIWVNPGGLAVLRDASVMLDLTVGRPGERGRLEQVTAGFSTRGLSFGYQRDNFANGIHGHTYRLGLGGASGKLGAGAALAFYRGATGGTGWDIGARYDWRPQFTVSGVVRNLGRPTVRGVRQDVTFVPALTLRPLGALLAVSSQAAFASSTTRGYAFQVNTDLTRPLLGFIARLDTDGSLRRTTFALGVSIGRTDRVGVVLSTPGDLSRLDAASLYGVATTRAASR